jgi:hypothetical protein
MPCSVQTIAAAKLVIRVVGPNVCYPILLDVMWIHPTIVHFGYGIIILIYLPQLYPLGEKKWYNKCLSTNVIPASSRSISFSLNAGLGPDPELKSVPTSGLVHLVCIDHLVHLGFINHLVKIQIQIQNSDAWLRSLSDVECVMHGARLCLIWSTA